MAAAGPALQPVPAEPAVPPGPAALPWAAALRPAALPALRGAAAAAVLPAAAAAEEEAPLGAEYSLGLHRAHRPDRHHLGCRGRGQQGHASGEQRRGTGERGAAAAPQAAKIGTAVRDGKFQFTITSISHAKSVGDTADGLGDTAQGEYTILHVTVTNIGSQPQTLDDSSQYVYDASGRKYDASTNADIDLNSASGSDSVFFNDINPGNTVRGELAFDMPAGVKVVKAELHDSAFSGGVTVNLR